MRAIHSRPTFIDIDKNALRFPIILLLWLLVVGLSWATKFRLDFSNRLVSMLLILTIIGGGFVLDGVYGERIITSFMAAHGYGRCSVGDWAHGAGKSRVWFAHYTLGTDDCLEGPAAEGNGKKAGT
jgi:hypothetical protein